MMAGPRKETEEEKAFRKAQEEVKSVLDGTHGAPLPEGTDYHYYKTFGEFEGGCKALEARIKSLMLRLPRAAKGGQEAFQNADDTYDWAMKLMDTVLVRVDAAVDEGNKNLEKMKTPNFWSSQNQNAVPTAAGQVAGGKLTGREAKKAQWLEAQQSGPECQRPQDQYKWEVDNSNTPFAGILAHWRQFVTLGKNAPARLLPFLDRIQLKGGEEEAPQPLAKILESISYPPSVLEAGTPIHYKGLDETPLTYIDTEEQLRGMVDKLETATEIAVDLEHHAYRTFQGLTCLMQLSDRSEDYVIDVLKLRHLIGPLLAPIFADPQVVKVMHGADWDVIWLQRDFGIYIASLFDTGQAVRVLSHPRYGLGHMLERLCKVKTDKRYQLADWRIRPLQSEMLLYARMDTHYLLYMYDLLRADLIKLGDNVPDIMVVSIPEGKPVGALGTVLERSRQISLKQYEKPIFTKQAWMEALQNFRDVPLLTKEQKAVFAALFQWRDQTARSRDDSVDFVLPKRQLLNISKAKPSTVKQLKQVLKGDSTPSLAHAAVEDIAAVVAQTLQALEEASPDTAGQVEPDLAAEIETSPSEVPPPPSGGPPLHVGLRPEVPESAQPAAEAEEVPTGQIEDSSGKEEAHELAGLGVSSSPAQLNVQQPEPQETTATAVLEPPANTAQDNHDGSIFGAKDAPSEVLLGHSMPEISQQITPASLPSANDKPDVQAVKPLKMAKSSGMRAMLGRKAAKAISALLGPVTAVDTRTTHSKKGVTEDATAQLRASMTVLYPKLDPKPMEAEVIGQASAWPDHTQQPLGATAASDIRAAADAIRSEGAAEDGNEAKDFPVKASEALGDYLPLPISQQYPKRGTHKLGPRRQAGEGNGTDQMHDNQELLGEEEAEKEEGELTDADAIMREAGLISGSESDKSLWSSEREPLSPKSGASGRAKKRQKLGLTDESGFLSVVEDTAPLHGENKATPEVSSKSGKQQQSSSRKGHSYMKGLGENGTTFDYSAARDKIPGLSLSLEEKSRDGRGGRRGRGGRGRGGPKPPASQPAAQKGFSPYNLDESKFMRGGKRSSVMPRSGNRNLTFR